jgi:WD40 repeat protein
MLRLVFHFGCIAVFLMLGFTSCRAQAVSRCQPERDLPKNPKPGVVGLNISRDGKTLVTAGADGNIRIWNITTGQIERTLSGHTNSLYKAVFSPNEKFLASSSRDRTARIWDIVTGRELYRLTGFRCSVKSVAFSPDGKTLGVVGNDGMLKVWDLKTGKELKSLAHSDAPNVDISVYSVVFSRDGRKIYAGNGDGTISEWDAGSGKETRNWKAHSGTVFALTFNSDYSVLASGSEDEANVKLWNTSTWREIRTLGEAKTPGLLEQLHPVAFSPDGKLIAAGFVGFDEKQRQYAYHRTFVWDVKTGEKLFTFEGHKLDINALVFTPDNRFLISGSNDTTIKFWDLQTGREARTLTQPPTKAIN